jgi:hypothetical protein
VHPHRTVGMTRPGQHRSWRVGPGRDCPTGKVRYSSEASSSRALRTIQRRSQEAVVPVRVYECESCEGWHLTSQPFSAAMPSEDPVEAGSADSAVPPL